jgi:FMN phosphatase YigB (HAD superfamily)
VKNRYDCVFFDSGGTLYGVFDSPGVPTPAQVSAGRFARVAALLGEFGAPAGRRELERELLRCERECPAELGAAYNFDRLMAVAAERLKLDIGPEIAACLADAYAGPRYRAWLFPGTEEMLGALGAAGLYLGVIANTAWPGHCMDRAFAGVGLRPYFKTRIYSADVGIEKPDPEFFRLAERVSGQAGKRLLYVGDSMEKDIAGAKGVGWDAALRLSGAGGSRGLADLDFTDWRRLVEFVTGRPATCRGSAPCRPRRTCTAGRRRRPGRRRPARRRA